MEDDYSNPLLESVARALCWANGMNPDLTLGGDGQNFLWHEYVHQANVAIDAYEKFEIDRDVVKGQIRTEDNSNMFCLITSLYYRRYRDGNKRLRCKGIIFDLCLDNAQEDEEFIFNAEADFDVESVIRIFPKVTYEPYKWSDEEYPIIDHIYKEKND